MIAGVVLAAGRSRRMGTPKALLRTGDETFVARALRVLREGGCDPLVVVVGTDGSADRIEAEAARARAHVAVNAIPESEQIDSVRTALHTLGDEVRAAVVLPVDVPQISSDTVRALIVAFTEGEPPIVLPTLRGEHGHPVLFGRAIWDELAAHPHPQGARSVIDAHRDEVREVEVDDEGALHDVNTPAELGKLRDGGGWAAESG